MNFKYGWLSLINSAPINVSDFISLAYATMGGPQINSSVIANTEFNTPTGGTWVASPISINSEPMVLCINPQSGEQTQIIADSDNMKIQMANLNAPPPLKSTVFLIGNPVGKYDYINLLPLNFGASNYSIFMISSLDNSVKPGSSYGNIPAIDFDRNQGPYTGIVNVNIMFTGYFGPVDLGIRLESSTNQSSMFDLRVYVLPPKV